MKIILYVAVFTTVANGFRAGFKQGNTKTRAKKFRLVDDMKFPVGFNTKAGIVGEHYRWPKGQLIYEIDCNFRDDEVAIIEAGMHRISSKTCIKFRARTTEEDYVFINKGDADDYGCTSYVGRQGGRQKLNLEVPEDPSEGTCLWPEVVAHELIHALGFEHEQSRSDRDDYVRINWDNIDPEYHYAFEKYENDTIDPFAVPYDYASIMHYDAYAFATNTSIPTIYPKTDGVLLGGEVVTDLDAMKINRMYEGICQCA